MKHNATPIASVRLINAFARLARRASLPILAALTAAGLVQPASAQHYTISSNWFVTNGVASTHIATGDVNRGIAYGVASNQVYVCNKGTPAIDVFDGTAGTYLGSANTTGVAGGTFLLDQVAVADDGFIYSANLTTSLGSSAYKLYQWQGYGNAPTTCFNGDPSGGTLTGKRMGDNLAVSGSGTSTWVLVPVENGTTPMTNVVIFSTTDGVTFTPTVFNISGMPAPSGNSGPTVGVTFYTNNTFLYKPNGSSLYLVQFPTNFASLTQPVQATVIATNTTFTSGSQLVLNYAPLGNLLAAIGPIPNAAPSTTPINLYLANPLTTASTTVGSTNSLHANGNGNYVGGIALGGQGKTNTLYTLDCNNGVYGWTLIYVPAPVAPTISATPVGGSVYTNSGSFTFNVTAAGTTPLYYFWQYNTVSNQATATTIAVTTNSGSYTLSPLTTNSSGWYDVIVSNVAGTSNTAPVQLTVLSPLTSAYVTQMWALPADNSQPYLDTSYNTRGLAFDPNTMSVLVAEHSAAQIYALNATNGQLKFLITTPQTGLPEGSIFPLGQVGVADDGVVYCCNVSSYQPGQQTGGVDFSITRFDSVVPATNGDGSINSSNTFEAAFTGDPGNYLTSYATGNGATYSGGDRWGDSFAVRGAGTNTQILLGTYETIGANQYGTGPGTNIAILTTTDGINFTPTTLVITDTNNGGTPPSGFAYLGVAWGAGNTFWTKSPGYNLRQISYNLTNGTGQVILSFSTTAGAGSLNNLDGIGLDNTNNILAGVQTSDTPNDLELFQIPTLGFPPQSYYQDFFPAYNPNINGNAATTIKFPYIFSLDANNGILGLKYSIPLLPFNILTTRSGNGLVLTWQTVLGRSYQLQSTPSLSGTPVWSNVGSPTVAPSSGTLSYTNTSLGGSALFYQVIAH